MISLCTPSKGRPGRFLEMYDSVRATAAEDFEVICLLDDDDPTADDYPAGPIYIEAEPGHVQSDLWNVCWERASGDIAMLCADDALFRTPGWDVAVSQAFELWPDRIGMVYTSNGTDMDRPEFPFCSREWIDAAGFFTPRWFRSWFADAWIWDVAAALKRRQYLPEIVVEHVCPAYGAPSDALYEEAARFRAQDQPRRVYRSMQAQRNRQVATMREHMVPGDYAWDERRFGFI